ncbi:MAG: Stf0 family sulfotransferase [Sphingomonadaceae bacterium]
MNAKLEARDPGIKRIGQAVVSRLRTGFRQLPLPGRHKHYRRFIIISSGRSGSTMLMERCHSHPRIACYGELLHLYRVYWHRRWLPGGDWRTLDSRERDPAGFLLRNAWHYHPRKRGAVGFKLLYSQFLLRERALRGLLADQDIKIIHLERRNLVETYMSFIDVQRRGMNYSRDPSRIRKLEPTRIDPEHCLKKLKQLEIYRAIVEDYFRDHDRLQVYYEDLLDRPEEGDRRICDFLGVERRRLSQRSVKLAKGSLADRIANYEELKARLNGTPWEACLASDPPRRETADAMSAA